MIGDQPIGDVQYNGDVSLGKRAYPENGHQQVDGGYNDSDKRIKN